MAANPSEPLIDAFAMRLTADGCSPKTVSAYCRDLRLAARALKRLAGRDSLLDATRWDLDAAFSSPFLLELEPGRTRAPASLNRMKAAVKSFFAWALETERIERNPAVSLKLKRAIQAPPQFLTAAEKRALLKELRYRSSPIAFRDRAIIELFLGTGIRLQELVDLNIADVDLDQKRIRIVGKGGISQVKFLKTGLRRLLRGYLQRRRKMLGPDREALFLSNRRTRISPGQVEHRFKHWIEKAGIRKKLSPHALRHTFCEAPQ